MFAVSDLPVDNVVMPWITSRDGACGRDAAAILIDTI
jgi:hypothetical protein